MALGSILTNLDGFTGSLCGTLTPTNGGNIVDLRSEQNLVAWYDASNAANLTLDGSNRVSQWNDIGPAASRHLINGTLASQPIYTAATGGSPAYVTFDGVDDFLLASFTLAQPSWIVLAVKQVSWTYPDAIMDGVTANTGKIAQDPPASSPSFAIFAGGTFGIFSTALAIGNFGVISTLFNGTNSSLAVNRGAVSAPGADVGTGTMGGITLGAQGPGNTAWSNIQVCGLAVFNAAPTSRSQTRVINYMMSKYNIAA